MNHKGPSPLKNLYGTADERPLNLILLRSRRLPAYFENSRRVHLSDDPLRNEDPTIGHDSSLGDIHNMFLVCAIRFHGE